MPWTDPPTWADDDTVEAAELNILSDDLRFLNTPPMVQVVAGVENTAGGGSSDATVVWSAQEFDTDNMWAPTPNPERITVQTPGMYLCRFVMGWAANGNGSRRASIVTSDGRWVGNIGPLPASADSDMYITVTGIQKMIAGQYFLAKHRQSSGVTLQTPTNALSFMAVRVADFV